MALSLNAFYSGYPITDYREEDKIIPIVLRAEASERETPERISTVSVYSTSTGTSVPLLQVAELQPEWNFSQVKRRNFENTITVSARNPDLYAVQLQKKLLPYLDNLVLPPGYRIEWGGEIEDSAKAQKALFANLPLCLTIAFILLVWQFNSIRRPAIVFLTMPLLIIGGAIGLFFMGATLSFVALLGFLSLGGIIINNAIVLIDRIDEERAEGKSVHDAVIAASLKRFRPIMMTTLTTVLGLVPLIFFGGAMWYGMANVIAFGLTVGTVLTLGVVPVLYVFLFGSFFNKARAIK
jgi:multidrug efflux pump subunit AcrB